MKKDPAAAVLLTTALLLVVPSFMRGQSTDLTKTENTIKGLFKKKKPAKTDTTAAAATTGGGGTAAAGTTASGAGPLTLTTYANYDFVPGEQVIFEDRSEERRVGKECLE